MHKYNRWQIEYIGNGARNSGKTNIYKQSNYILIRGRMMEIDEENFIDLIDEGIKILGIK